MRVTKVDRTSCFSGSTLTAQRYGIPCEGTTRAPHKTLDTGQGFGSTSVRHSQVGRLELEVAAPVGDEFPDDGDDVDRGSLVQGARQPHEYGAVLGVHPDL